jgi:hypothetical protein
LPTTDASPFPYRAKSKESQVLADSRITQAFGRWLLDDFRRAGHAVDAERLPPAELVALLTPWLQEIARITVYNLSRPEASTEKSKELIDRALDLIEAHYLRRGEPAASFVADLVPVAHLLADLALAWRGLRRPESRRAPSTCEGRA